MVRAAFGSEVELCNALCVTDGRLRRRQSAPASAKNNHSGTQEEKPNAWFEHLPGEARIPLPVSESEKDIEEHLAAEFETEELDRLVPYLGLMATQDSSHISALTKQIVRDRQIIITEEARLHLVWYYDRIFIKPIPEYLLPHAFWELYLKPGARIAPAVKGFMRSYYYLIRHKSDFNLSISDDHRLLPESIEYPNFIRFISAFKDIPDHEVSPRWKFGDLRGTRLNFWSKIFLRQFTYLKVHGQYGAYFARYYAPILFAFGIFSVVLNAMQLAIAVQPLDASNSSWKGFAFISQGFAIFTIVLTVGVCLGLGLVLIAMVVREMIYALKDWFRKRWPKKGNDIAKAPRIDPEASPASLQ
jgi:hypothetical protein